MAEAVLKAKDSVVGEAAALAKDMEESWRSTMRW